MKNRRACGLHYVGSLSPARLKWLRAWLFS